MRNLMFAVLAGACLCVPAYADSLENIGTIAAIALPLTAGGISVFKNDWTGVAQVVVGTGLTVGTVYGLKQVIREKRPDKSDMKSFPSDTAALAFAPASYLWDRYGWEYGVPAYAAASFVAYSRVHADKHHWWDVATSAVIAFTFSKLITTEYTGPFYTNLYGSPDGAYAKLGYRW